ncbi:hypothetical protein KCP71_15350 [Salmonella enterica subsp. enterica]|nr:hypothetical protein KCP71_15350 [Salmonella enterica subsp. enterica]
MRAGGCGLLDGENSLGWADTNVAATYSLTLFTAPLLSALGQIPRHFRWRLIN